ncbi:hypothetical protein KFE98_18665 [bacterium SCSIO 12741]|nr:hypothetical protein KFE98_18665 [bacterium SCSIO 12741]
MGTLSNVGSFVPVFLGLAFALLLVYLMPVVKSYIPVQGPETNYFTLALFAMVCLFIFDALRSFFKSKGVA